MTSLVGKKKVTCLLKYILLVIYFSCFLNFVRCVYLCDLTEVTLSVHRVKAVSVVLIHSNRRKFVFLIWGHLREFSTCTRFIENTILES